MRLLRMLPSLLLVTIAAPLPAQVICLPGFPAPSPVQSYSPDDIPATNDHLMTYTGSHVAARANHPMSFVQIGPNEQKVWFFSDNTTIDTGHTYYNRRYRANASSPWYWEFSISPSIITDAPVPSAVLYSSAPKYIDTRTNTAYSYIMYQVQQPSVCLPSNTIRPSAGYMYVAFSNDGICWTSSQLATRLGGPFAPCIGASNTVPIEAMTAFDTGSQIAMIGVEGDIIDLSNRDNMSQTMTAIGSASYASPGYISLYDQSMVVNTGVLLPTNLFLGRYSYEERFEPYAYFFNLQGAYDASSGDLYLARAYAYPFDRGSKDSSDNPQSPNIVPQGWQGEAVMMFDPATGRTVKVGGCNPSPWTLPNRIQLYKMHIGSLSCCFAMLGTFNSHWTFVADIGNASGYSNWVTGATTTPLAWSGQTNSGRDYASVSFIRDGEGNLMRDNGIASFLAGDTVELSKSNGPCQVTGLERETLLAVP